MTLEEMRAWAEDCGLRLINDVIVGEWKGYPLVASFGTPGIRALSATFSLSRPPKAKNLRLLRKFLPEGFSLTQKGSRVTLVCSGHETDFTGLATMALDSTIAMFRDSGAKPPQTCPLCHRYGCDSLAMVGGSYVPVHHACCQPGMADVGAEAGGIAENYFTGWMGALLGGGIASIPSILVAWFFQFASAWLYALIPLGAYYGYKLLRGKMNHMAITATIIASLFQPFFIEQILCYAAIVTNIGIWPSPIDAVLYYFEIMRPETIFLSAAQSLLFLFIGLFVVLRIIAHTNAYKFTVNDVMAESLMEWSKGPSAHSHTHAPSYISSVPPLSSCPADPRNHRKL